MLTHGSYVFLTLAHRYMLSSVHGSYVFLALAHRYILRDLSSVWIPHAHLKWISGWLDWHVLDSQLCCFPLWSPSNWYKAQLASYCQDLWSALIGGLWTHLTKMMSKPWQKLDIFRLGYIFISRKFTITKPIILRYKRPIIFFLSTACLIECHWTDFFCVVSIFIKNCMVANQVFFALITVELLMCHSYYPMIVYMKYFVLIVSWRLWSNDL